MALTTVADVGAMLRWGAAETMKYEGQLAPYIAAASEIVERESGPFEARTVAFLADGAPSIGLPNRPTAVTLVEVPNGSGGWTTITGWSADLGAGIVYGPFYSGRQTVRITYTVGTAPELVPAAAKLAATMIAADTWAVASQRAPGLDEQFDPSYLMPKKVRELLASIPSMPGFA